MDFRQRKIAYEELKGTSHLDADRALLEKVDPKNPLLQKKVYKPETLALEILWELLGRADVAREMVVSNRRASTDSTSSATTATDNGEIDNDTEGKAKEDAIIALLAADLVAMPQKELNALALVLEIDAPDRKAATLRPLLEDYRANLQKDASTSSATMAPGTGEKMDDLPAQPDGNENELKAESSESHSDQVIDQMNADIGDIKAQLQDVNLSDEKKAELEQRLNDLESNIDDLQDQHNELQDQVNTLADDIEAEKKNQDA